MKNNLYIIQTLFLLFFFGIGFAQNDHKQYQPVVLDFKIESTTETSSVNPFTDYRLQVDFVLGDKLFSIPGYYAADGDAAETSASSGGVWRVIFTPNTAGNWKSSCCWISPSGLGRYAIQYTRRMAPDCVTTRCNSWLFRLVVPCQTPPGTHPGRRPTAVSRLKCHTNGHGDSRHPEK